MNEMHTTNLDQLDVSSPVLDLARRVARAFRGSDREIYLVGGAVRDLLLHVPVQELDFTTSASPPQIAAIIEPLLEAGPFRMGERFGTVGGILAGLPIEITTFRSAELYRSGSRKPDVQFGSSVLEDLGRRDFTINAVAADVESGDLIDPYGGVEDLRRGIIRCVGDARHRFEEDPLRLLRGVRFATRLDFTIDPDTWSALCATAERLLTISRERIRDEYGKILCGPRASRGLTMLRDSGLMEQSVPELLELDRMPDHGPRHPLSLWDHTMRVIDGVPLQPRVRWAALLHDVGKPATRSLEPDGRIRFFHHEEIGARIARDVLSGLRYSSDFVAHVVLLVGTHMQMHAYSEEWSDGAVRRLMLRLGDLLPDALQLARADAAGHGLDGHGENAPKFDALEARVEALNNATVQGLASPLSGDDLMARYSRPPGPWIRTIKEALLDEVVEGRLRPDDRAGAWIIADRLASGVP